MKDSAEIEIERQHTLKQFMENWDYTSEAQLSKRFGAGTHGMHEALHAIYMIQTSWNDFVVNSAACCLDKEAYRQAAKIERMIADLYQHLGRDH